MTTWRQNQGSAGHSFAPCSLGWKGGPCGRNSPSRGGDRSFFWSLVQLRSQGYATLGKCFAFSVG